MTRTLVLELAGLIYGPAKSRFGEEEGLPVFVFRVQKGKRCFVLAFSEGWRWIETEAGFDRSVDVKPEECDPVLTAVGLRAACIDAGFQLSPNVMLDTSSSFQVASVELYWSEEWRIRWVNEDELLAAAGYDAEEDEFTLARVRDGEVQAFYRTGFESESDFSLSGPPAVTEIENETELISRFEALFGWQGQVRGRSALDERPVIEIPDEPASPMTWALRRAVTCGLAFLGGANVDLHLRLGELKLGDRVLEKRIVLFQPGRTGPGRALILVFPSVGQMFAWIGERRPETFYNVFATVSFDGRPPVDFIRFALSNGHRVRVLFHDAETAKALTGFRSANLTFVDAERFDHVEDREVETPEVLETRIVTGGAR